MELDGFFRVITNDASSGHSTYTLTFEDGGKWVFNALNPALGAKAGKIKDIIDLQQYDVVYL